jgi:hypothetical protein
LTDREVSTLWTMVSDSDTDGMLACDSNWDGEHKEQAFVLNSIVLSMGSGAAREMA